MVQLNRSMMERYEIADRRPEKLRALIFGADALMLGVIARLLDDAGIGAACATSHADALAPQDGMFTLMIRGESIDGKRIKEERVIQSILRVIDPEKDIQALIDLAPEIEVIFCHAESAAEQAFAAALMRSQQEQGLPEAKLLLVSEAESAPSGLGQRALAESLCGRMTEAEASWIQREMNYRDDFLAWAEPHIRLIIEGEVPELLATVCQRQDYENACARKMRVFDAAVFLCTAAGYLAGKQNFAETLRDETIRGWIGHAFFDEILPSLPYEKDDIAPDVISAFERLENPMNDMKLLEIGKNLLSRFPESILPSIRAFADKNFEAPIGPSFALAAAIMLYAGAREEGGAYCVARGNEKDRLIDDPEILESFARFSHDMPAETLAYAALADRSIWGMDLREIDGLEMRVAYDLSAIQRIGFAEALKLKVLEWEE